MGRTRALWALLVATVACGGEMPSTPTVLEVVMADDWAGAPAVVDAIRDFEAEHPDLRVRVRPVQFEFMNETVRQEVRTGDAPDVVQWHAFAAGAQGLAEPLDDLWDDELTTDEFFPGSIEDVEWAGRRYGVPLDANAMLLIYNADRFRAAGVETPGPTFAELARAAERLTSEDGSRRAIALASSSWHAYGWIRANGGELLEVGSDDQPVFTFDRPENIEALDFLAGLVRRGHAFPPVGRAGDRVDAFALLRSEVTFVHASGSWDVATLEKEQVGWSHRTALMPGGADGGDGTVLGGSSLFVPRGARNPAAARELMLHLVSDRYALRLAKEEGRLPVRLRVYEDEYFQTPVLRSFVEQMKIAHPFKLEAFPDEHAVFREVLPQILQGDRGAAEALADAQGRVAAAPPR